MIALEDQLRPARSLAVDTETRSLRMHDPAGIVFLITWSDADGDDYCTPDDEAGVARFHAALAGVERLLFANASFDVHALRNAGIVDLMRSGHEIVDIQTIARVVMPERGFKGYKLKDLSADLLGASAKAEQDHLKTLCDSIGIRSLNTEGAHHALWEVYPREVEAYAMKDTRLTFDLGALLCKRATPQDLAIAKFEVGNEVILREMERTGALVDKPALAEVRAEYEAKVRDMGALLRKQYTDGLEAYITRIARAGWRVPDDYFVGASVKARRARIAEHAELYARGPRALAEDVVSMALGDDGESANQTALRSALLGCGVPLYKTTDKSGQLATNKDALGEFEDEYPVIGNLFAYRRAGKLLSTYVAPLELADPRVHTSISTCAARTSRMTSRSPNLQNLPRAAKGDLGPRRVIIPKPNNALLVCDYDGIEVYTLAHYLKRAVHEPGLADALEAGLDAHVRTATKVFGQKPHGKGGPPAPLAASELYAWYTKGAPGEPYRTLAKTTTFSAMYGIGYKKLAIRLGVSADEAKEIKASVLNAIDGYWDLVDALRIKMSRVGHLRTALGRRLDVPAGKTHVYLNSVVQGTAAEIMKLGMRAAVPKLAPLGYVPILVVHDELLSEGPVENADEAQAVCIAAMESVHSGLLTVSLKATGGWTTESYAAAK